MSKYQDFNVEPGNVFMSASIRHPRSVTLCILREAIVLNPKCWKRLKKAKALGGAGCEIVSNSLKHHRGLRFKASVD